MAKPVLSLAPMRGITDCLFRTIFQRHFGGLDHAVAPFISPQRLVNSRSAALGDLLPEANPLLPVIPQLLHSDPGDFIELAKILHGLGHEQLNWNLGCPAPMVARKRRGSGLLPYPDAICSVLDAVCPAIPQRLSLKTRLGYADPSELPTLLPRLDDYPLSAIIIHARLGKQLYRGEASPEAFGRCLPLTRHPVVYNGDIVSPGQLAALRGRFPRVSQWMIGRGLLADPFLALEIQGIEVDGEERLRRLRAFHDELYLCYQQRLAGPAHLLGKMKQLWSYLIHAFPGREKVRKKIHKANTTVHYEEAVGELLANDCKAADSVALAPSPSGRSDHLR